MRKPQFQKLSSYPYKISSYTPNSSIHCLERQQLAQSTILHSTQEGYDTKVHNNITKTNACPPPHFSNASHRHTHTSSEPVILILVLLPNKSKQKNIQKRFGVSINPYSLINVNFLSIF